MASRSSGLGVQRPRMIAPTRDSSTPERSASCRTSMPCSAHSCSMVWVVSAIAGSSLRAAAELRAVAVHVLDLRLVPPGDLLRFDAQGGGQAAALFRAG